MIRNISFAGTVKIDKNFKSHIPNEHKKLIQKFADDSNTNIVITDKTQYKSGEAIYSGWGERLYMNKRLCNFIVDTKYPHLSKTTLTEMPAEYYY